MLFFVVLISCYCLAGVTSYNVPLKELPQEISQQLMDLIKSPNMHLPVNCRRRVKVELQYLLYNRENQVKPIVLNASDASELKDNRNIKILIHGWLSSPNTAEILDLKDAYLQKYDYNVIMINWDKSAMQLYQSSYCHAASISYVMGKVLCTWNKKMNIDLDKVHIIGHSMGAHISGLAGRYVASMCKAEIGRITGLDPSKSLYNNPKKDFKLSKSNAKMVDIIYTDNAVFGIERTHGDLNFYPNCGQRQPGCPEQHNINNSDLLSQVMCNQIRSLEYMTESVSHGNGIAVSCSNCPLYCRPDIITETYMPMGETASFKNQYGSKSFTINTHATSPYFTPWQQYSI